MTAPVTELTHAYLLSILSYNPNSGEFRWKVSRGRVKAGYVAGHFDTHGYKQILIDKIPYLAGRLAWFYMKGVWPEQDIGYRDNNRANTAWTNLVQQPHGPQIKKKPLGRPRANKPFRAKVHVGKERKTISLGWYSTREEAAAAVRAYREKASAHV